MCLEWLAGAPFSPLEINCLDDKAQGWTHCRYILVHDLFHNGRFTRIIQTTNTH